MIHVPRMTQLMDQQVAQNRWLLEQAADVQADGASGRAAAPAGALAANLHPAKLEIVAGAQFSKLPAELPMSKFHEPVAKRVRHFELAVDRASDDECITGAGRDTDF